MKWGVDRKSAAAAAGAGKLSWTPEPYLCVCWASPAVDMMCQGR